MTTSRENHLQPSQLVGLEKCPSGIPGLDQISNGGLPRERTTLVCGGAGSGKTLMGIEFLVKGAVEYGEPGVLMCFEENAEELAQNVASLGFDLNGLIANGQLVIDYVRIERSEIEETGEYDLSGLFIRLGLAIDTVGAKRVVLDTLEALFAALPNESILRAELRRLFRWLKDKGVTAIITGERGEGSLTRFGLEEYVSDCVIVLDQRIVNQIATRRLRIAKYRGSAHGANEYPFLLDEKGFTVVPITAISLQYSVSTERVSTGIPKLDLMLAGKGYYRGSTSLITGTAGSGKTSLSAQFVDAACGRGERTLYFLFEEAPEQFMRNMRSIGIDLQRWADKGLLRFHASRPATYGLEMHLAFIERMVEQFQPQVVVLDPVSSFDSAGSLPESQTMLMRLIDFLKSRRITTLFTSLTAAGNAAEQSEMGISSLIDSWLLLRNLEQGGERTRLLYILKARGTAHSNRIREFVMTDNGIDLLDVYVGPEGILTGSARIFQEMQDRLADLERRQDNEHKHLIIERKRKALEAKIAELQAEFDTELHEIETSIAASELDAERQLSGRMYVAATQKSKALSEPSPAHEGDQK
ncbi:MAG: circadian clock protein KaiC [Methylococcales bacterium]|nr:circadian clock protein KaiC [Methylococcales bacterium]